MLNCLFLAILNLFCNTYSMIHIRRGKYKYGYIKLAITVCFAGHKILSKNIPV